MGNIKLLVLIMAAFGLANGKRMFRKCTFCRYFYTTGHSPYELLWILSDEISAQLSEDQRITLFLDEEDLTKAELVFETFCEKICNKNSVSVVSEAVTKVAGTGPRMASRLDNKPFYEPHDSEMSPQLTDPNRRTLFKGVKIPPQSERAPFAEKVSAESSAIAREENDDDGENDPNGERGKEFRKHSGEYEISDGSSGVRSGSAETEIFGDDSDEYVNRSGGLSIGSAKRTSESFDNPDFRK